MGLSYDWTALNTKVDAMYPNGNTNQAVGLPWGWQSLTESPFTIPAFDPKYSYKQIIILLTDGMNAWSSANNHNKSVYSSFGYYGAGRLTDPGGANPTTSAAARAQMEAKTLSACGNAKAAGVTVYTVGFSVSSDPIDATGLDLLKKCASSPQMAYVANDSSTIVTVFEEIAKSIGGLRLTQ